MLRYFGHRGFLVSSKWVPHTVEVLTMAQGVFGSAFPSPSGEEVVYTIVNRMPEALTAPHLLPASASGMKFYDCYNGVEIWPDATTGTLSFEILGHDFGCVLATKNSTDGAHGTPIAEEELRGVAPAIPQTLTALLQTMKALTKQHLSSFDANWKDNVAKQEVVSPIGKTAPLRPAGNASATEVYVKGSVFNFQASMVHVEGAAGSGVGVQFPWENVPHRHHNHTLQIGALYVDKHPVTNDEYASYLTASRYHPFDSAHWLQQNFEGDKPKKGWGNKPVTYVSLQDAKEYCKYHGKRLPHAYEWQYFAQSTDGRIYPWGNEYETSRVPKVSNNFTNPGPEPVGQYPSGASPFHVQDLVGSVWQYTTEFQDNHTRSVVLRGGSNYCPWRADALANNHVPGSYDPTTGKNLSHPYGGSHWYFRPTFRLDNYNKYFVMSGSYERAGTIGFRCVADAVDDCGTDGLLCISSVSVDGVLADTNRADGAPTTSNRTWRAIAIATHALVDGDANETIVIKAPAPLASEYATLKLHLGSKLGAHGNLTATVSGQQTSVHVTPDIDALSLRYTAGPLKVTVSNILSTVCTNLKLCLLSTQEACPYGKSMAQCVTNLSRDGVTDWAHWGNLYTNGNNSGSEGKWFANRKKGGPGLLQPTLELPASANSKTDLSTWAGQYWPSDRLVYSWTGGSPTESAGDTNWWSTNTPPSPRAGVTSAIGTFKMVVPAPSGPGAQSSAQRWKLTLYLGLGDFGNAFGCSAVLTLSSLGQPNVSKVVEHDYGSNNNWRNTVFTVIFDGELTVTWALGPNTNNQRGGLLSFQAATLEEHHGGVGGVVIESATMA
jgi:formylglycine-generating enzyme required for sulfatase activity